MSAVRPTGGAALARLRLSGLVFLMVIGALVWLTIALYQKAFTPVVRVTLQADTAGNQLSKGADVKVRGLIVGEARSITSTGSGAEISLALDPAQVHLVPKNVEARLLPKTLFGEKYVELVVPEQPSATAIAAGDVIPQDRSSTARETEKALNDLLPLLQTLKPEQVSVTLNALSSALRGRGDRVGANLVLVRDYLAQFNPELPTLAQDFAGLADFADTVDQANPDIVQVLDNLSAVSRSLVATQGSLDRVLRDTAGVSDTTKSFLADNEKRLVTLANDSLPSLQVYARYSPEFPCVARGLALSDKSIGDAFGVLQPGLHITLETVQDNNGYVPGQDEPRYLDDRGPVCYGLDRLPNGGPPVPMGDTNYRDGYRDGSGGSTTATSASSPFGPASFSGPQGQRSLINAVVAPVLGVSSDSVPDLAQLLFGPVARGTAVGLSSGSTS